MSDSENDDDLTIDFDDNNSLVPSSIEIKRDDDRNQERYDKLGFKPVKELYWNRYLPYADKLDDESQQMLQSIKENLVKAITMGDLETGVGLYTERLFSYTLLYGYKFSKDDLINFIKIYVELISLDGLGPITLSKYCSMLNRLLQKYYLISPDELEIEWQPLYKLSQIYLYKESKCGKFYQYYHRLHLNLRSVIRKCSMYFPKSSTREILDEILPQLPPLDTGRPNQIFEILNLFLNFHHGYELWFDDFMNIWDTYNDPLYSDDILEIMINLAHENIGKIDWEPYLPIMFSRILRFIDLPVNYKNLKLSKSVNFSIRNISKWIIAVLGPNTSGQKYLTNFISAIESYLHPANVGKWLKPLGHVLSNLPQELINRLENERFRKPSWNNTIPESYKLTEKCITDFVESLKSAAFQAMYSRIDPFEITKLFCSLSKLRPELIIPEVIDRVFLNVESLTEPHRLTSSLLCLVSVSQPLICGQNGYTNGRTQIIPILFALLPGIDPNDVPKTISTLNFYGSFICQMLIVDCSTAGQYYDDLTENESLVCEQTADFKDFVLQFLDRLFVVIKYSAQENTRMEHSNTDNNKSRLDLLIENSLSTGLQIILLGCSEDILLTAAKKITDFVKDNLLDPYNGATLIVAVIQTIAHAAGPYTFKILVPYLTEKLLIYINDHDDIENYEKHSDDFLYNLTILCALFKGDPRETIKYIDDSLIPILDRIITFKCKLTQKITQTLISYVLLNLSKYQLYEFNNENLKLPLSEYLPIRHWGEKINNDTKFKWFIPGNHERLACEKILNRYLPNILEKFDKYSSGELKTLHKDDIYRDINLILSFIRMPNFLPIWNEPLKDEGSKVLCDTVVNKNSFNIIQGFENLEIRMQNNENVRLTIIKTIDKLQKKLLNDSSDDIKSLKSIAILWERIHIRKIIGHSYDQELKSYLRLKRIQETKLRRNKKDIKLLAVKRILAQITCRNEFSPPIYTETTSKIIKNLLQLSTSHYSAVRIIAQFKLFTMLSTYSFAYVDILDDLVDLLKLDSTENHKKFKGALFLIIGSVQSKMLTNPNWICVEKLWVNLLKSKPSEKLSIVYLIDSCLHIIKSDFVTLTLKLQNNDSLIYKSLKLINNLNDNNYDESIEVGKIRLEKFNNDRMNCYLRIIESIVNTATTTNLHWRYHYLASQMITVLMHPHINYPTIVAKYVVDNLLNDSIKERKSSIGLLTRILEQQKRKHKRIKIDPFEIAGVEKPLLNEKLKFGLRPDNLWLQYDIDRLPKNQLDWDKPVYLHKSNGFFGWSKNLAVYAPYNEQPSVDRERVDMNDIEKVIYDFFIDKENFKHFIDYLSLEENKDKEKFKLIRFEMIKFLFKIYGDVFFDNFLPHLKNLIEDNKHKSNHRCAAEILSGIMRGMKHWPYDKTENAYKKLIPLINLALDSVTVETDDFWGICFATATEHIDPKRQYWLHEALIDNPLRETTSFVNCCRIFCIQGTFNQHIWRMNSYAHRLLKYLRPYLNHSFQNVRVRLGSMLINIFQADIQFKNGNPPQCPRAKDLIDEIIVDLNMLNKDEPNKMKEDAMETDATVANVKILEDQKKYEEAVRLFKTISPWIFGIITRTNGNELPYFDLLPYACRLESSESDSELAELSSSLIALISQALTLPHKIEYALEKFDKISKSNSWNSRLAIVDALQVLVFHNMAIILSQNDWVIRVQNIVLRLLEDQVLEVREKAAEVLGGLLHCSFLPATDKLLELFKRKCKTKFLRKQQLQLHHLSTCSMEARLPLEVQENEAIRLRHSGVLGICAFISAFPYDIPDFVPDLFECLGEHSNDPQPISTTIRKTVGNFKRTHHENWDLHQQKFTENQLAVLTDLTIPPSYYV